MFRRYAVWTTAGGIPIALGHRFTAWGANRLLAKEKAASPISGQGFWVEKGSWLQIFHPKP